MARVRITRREAERGLLPPVCALTGQPTDDVKRKSFLWQPPWVGVLILAGLLPYLIVSLILRKSMAVQLPLVRAKHGHWAWRVAVGALGIVGSVVLFFVGVAVESDRTTETLGGILMAAGGLGVLAFLIVWVVLYNTSIRPSEITDFDITLVGVHEDFVRALEDDRDRDEEEYERRRDRERERRRADDDDRPRRARRADEDDDYDDR